MKLQILLVLLIGTIAVLNANDYYDPYEYKDTDSNDYYESIDAEIMKPEGMPNTIYIFFSNQCCLNLPLSNIVMSISIFCRSMFRCQLWQTCFMSN